MGKLGEFFLKEFEREGDMTKTCLERVPFLESYRWKPSFHSIPFGEIALAVADIPRWLVKVLTSNEMDISFFEEFNIRTSKDLVNHFDKHMKILKEILKKIPDSVFDKKFSLKDGPEVLRAASGMEFFNLFKNHFIHTRGQMTIYMGMNEILVPSIYNKSPYENIYK